MPRGLGSAAVRCLPGLVTGGTLHSKTLNAGYLKDVSLLIGAVVAKVEEPHRLRRVMMVSRFRGDRRTAGNEGIFLPARSFNPSLKPKTPV